MGHPRGIPTMELSAEFLSLAGRARRANASPTWRGLRPFDPIPSNRSQDGIGEIARFG
jgi:hypothetical protein